MKNWFRKGRELLGVLKTSKDEEVGMFIPQRQVSWITSAILIFGFLSFLIGYFWGHRRALERFVAKVEEESFADRINYALYTMNDRDFSEFEEQEDVNGADEQASSEEESGNGDANDEQEEVTEIVEVEVKEGRSEAPFATKTDEPEKIETHKNGEPAVVYVAPLAGFGTLQAAQECIRRITFFDASASIKKQVSRTAKGRAITWYQVVTGQFEKREDLEKLVNTIKKAEHIKNVQIIEMRKGNNPC